MQMRRKDVGIHKVYDARALRVVVGDKNGTLHGPAIQCCYSLLDIVHRYIIVFLLFNYCWICSIHVFRNIDVSFF